MAIITPTLNVVVDKSEYQPGETITLTATGNHNKKRTYKFEPDLGFTLVSSDAYSDVFTATAPDGGGEFDIKVTANRTWTNTDYSDTVHVSVATPSVPSSRPRMGVSMSDEDHGLPHWDAAHCYNLGDVDTSQRNPITAESVQLSDINRWTVTGTVNAAGVKSDLQNLRNKYPDLIIRYSWGNEVDRHVSKSQIANYVKNLKAIRTVIDSLNDDKITLWTSFTKGVFANASWIGSGIDDWVGIKDVVDGIAVNQYPPSREKNVNSPTPYAQYVDESMEKIAAWGVKLFAAWEWGHPIINNSGGQAPYRNRPEYAKGYRDYVIAKAEELGLTVTELDYWDQDIGIDNRLFHDAPKTAQAWVTF